MALSRTRIDASLVFVLSAVVLVAGMTRNMGVYDEGLVLTGAMRVASGDIPHADFYTNYGPAQFYILAGLFKLLGTSAMVERVYDTLVRAAIAALCYVMVAQTAPRPLAWAAAMVCVLWLFAVGLYGWPLFPVVLLSLWAAWLIQPVLRGSPSRWRLAASGGAVGLSALLRYDIGFVLFLALALVLAMAAALRTAGAREAFRELRSMGTPFLLGTSLVFLPAAAAYLAMAPVAAFIEDIFFFSIPNYAHMRSLPFPGLGQVLASVDQIAVYTPALIFLATVFSFLASTPRTGALRPSVGDEKRTRRDWLIVTLAIVTGAMYLKGLVRVSTAHLMGAIIPSVILLTVLSVRAWSQGRAARAIVSVLAAASLASALDAASVTAAERIAKGESVLAKAIAIAAAPQGLASGCTTPPELRNIECLLLDPDREEAARIVALGTSPAETIFVGNTRHDIVHANDNMFYFATGRKPATRWHHFDPGLQTRADVQAMMIHDLEAQHVRYVVLESTWEGVIESNDSVRSSGVTLLDDYLRTRYRKIAQRGNISVLLRDPAGPH